MIVMGLKLGNVLCFDDFSISFSYPTKLRTSLIKNESLSMVPSFRYKKLNVFVGSNASGKTSLVKAIWRTLLFLNNKEARSVTELVQDANKDGFISIDLVSMHNQIPELHRFEILIEKLNSGKVLVAHKMVKLSTAQTSTNSYENKKAFLDAIPTSYVDYVEALKDINFVTGWNLVLPATEENFDKVTFPSINGKEYISDYFNILNSIFTVLDPSISKVSRSTDSNDAIVIEYLTGRKVVVQEGMPITSIPFLSSGTKYGINIANMIFSIKHHINGIYLFDEQFSYLNSDTEAAILSTMVSLLGDNEQLFFTTHNNEILDLGYPFHSYYFLKKEIINNEQIITASCGSEAENRNNVSARTLVDNDVFGTAPNVNKILSLGD